MSASIALNQVWDDIVRWYGDTTNPIKIDLQDPSYPSDHYIAKMLSRLVNIFTGLTKRLIAMENLVSELATRERLVIAVFPG
jgi:hypothetical protein